MAREIKPELGNENKDQLEKIREKAKKGDVTYDLNRWFGERMRQGDPELLEMQKQGFEFESIYWLNSTTTEKMKYGKATKEERLIKAREFAEKAQTTIEALAKQHGIDLT